MGGADPAAPVRQPAPVRFAVATGLGIGIFAPFAPGTFGSAAGVVLFWAVTAVGGAAFAAAATVLVTVAGFWSAGAAERHLGRRDPGPVVIDEIAGQMLSLLWLPTTWPVLAAGFVLFRVLDVTKPFPARRLESLPGGSGIMADDLAVGVYANLALRAAILLLPAWTASG